jgi:REP element-mobilizing transposase RayT
MPDHVHLLAQLHPSVSVARLAGDLKGFSSHFVTRNLRTHLEWQSGYAAYSISAEDVEAVARYVTDQKRHHDSGVLHPLFELADGAKPP